MASYTTPSSSDSDECSRNVEVIYFSNDFPKEDLQELFRRLHNHAKSTCHMTLAQFINIATAAIKNEIQILPTELKELFPPFDTLLSWAEEHDLRKSMICGAVDGVLLTVFQLSTYLGYLETHPDELHRSPNAIVAGLGVGLLASSAVSTSSALTELTMNGAEAVRLAFRMGIHVQSVSQILEVREPAEGQETWAYVVHNVDLATVQAELDILNQPKQVPDTGRIFVSASGQTSVTLSGPPTRLKALFKKSPFFRATRFIALPVYGGLCHAPHIYGEADMQKVVDGNSLCAADTVTMPLYSTSTGVPYPAQNPAQMFEYVIWELLTKPICWDHVTRGIAQRVKSSAASEVSLHCFGNSLPLNDLKATLVDGMPQLTVSTEDLIAWTLRPSAASATPRDTTQSKLAIVGMSCRLPGGATNTAKFWELLVKGLDVSQRIPADRFDIDTYCDPTGTQLNKSMIQYGCFVDDPGLFDAPFFNMSPREAQTVDPQMRLALVTAYEALERAGCVGGRTAATRLERIGTWYGQAADDYREVNQGQAVGTYYIPGGCRAFGPGRVNYFFKFAGPSYSIDTACSSGLAAIEVACQALWNGEVDTAVAGGLNILTNPDGFAGLCNGHFLTKGHNACKTWDASADGYCRADGIGSVVIKRLEDAEADNDNILGVILGAGTNHSAQAVSITHPHAGHQAYLSRRVLQQAGVDPLDVSFVELHGTGTQAGDYEEMKGIMEVYAPLTRRRRKDQPLHIGAVKSNVGHSESAAGTTALIKVLLMLQNNAIPPHVGIKTEVNQRFPKDFDKRNLHIPFVNISWPHDLSKKRIAAINNFGAAGGNTTMILEEPPTRKVTDFDPRHAHVVAVSAKTKRSLSSNIERLIGYLDANPNDNLSDLSYTTTARRLHYSYRVVISTSDKIHLRQKLVTGLEKIDTIKPTGKSSAPQIAFTYTGQGASSKSMSLELYRDVPIFRECIQQLDGFAKSQGFPSFIPALDGSYHKDYAHDPVVTQLALLCAEIALTKYWESLGIKPDVVCGHSLGEYAAMHAAGVISANEAIFMVGRRAEMLKDRCQAGSHTMMAVRTSVSRIAECSDRVAYSIACINGSSDTVLSGTKQQMEEMRLILETAEIRCIMLDVTFAFHSEQTDPILDDFESIAKTGVIFREPKVPVISPLLGRVIFDGKTIDAGYVRRATREPVDFLSSIENAREASAISDDTIWIEIGPHPVCTGFIKSTSPATKLAIPSLRRNDNNWKTIAESLALLHVHGVDICWNEFHRPFEKELRLLDLPTYAWDEKNYWLQYNGDWCLTKGNDFYGLKKENAGTSLTSKTAQSSEIQTSTVQNIIDLTCQGTAGSVTMQSDLMQPDFLAAAHGHRMNNCGVITSSIHADIAYTLGRYLYHKLCPKRDDVGISITDLDVTRGLVAQNDVKTPQLIRVTATTLDIGSGVADLTWYNVAKTGVVQEPFATAKLLYGNAFEWLSSWVPFAHLIQSRIDALEHLTTRGEASRFTRNMAYTLFASNLVDYAERYRGMQCVVLHDLEGFADVQLTEKEGGIWTVPPYFIDSVAHLAGFIMNCSDTIDTRNNFCVTPGWKSMRFAKELVPGCRYRSYVKMISTPGDPTTYAGDVYIMQDGVIVGMVGGIQFRRYPRILLSRFFSPPDKAIGMVNNKIPTITHPVTQGLNNHEVTTNKSDNPEHIPSASTRPESGVAHIVAPLINPIATLDSIVNKALKLIAREAELDMVDLDNEANFADLGIDSLMSLVITEKFKTELDVHVGGSLFLDYPRIGDLRNWLEAYYG